MYKELERVARSAELFTHKTAAAEVLHKLAMKFHRRSFVVIITDLFSHQEQMEGLFKSLQHLRHAKHEVLVFHLLDKKTEELFEFPNRPIILRDLETGEKLEVRPGEVRGSVPKDHEALQGQLQTKMS